VGPKAGWYPDPIGGTEVRYWGGGAWTNRVMSDSGEARPKSAPDPAWEPPLQKANAAAEAAEDADRQKRLGCGLTALWVIGGALVIALSVQVGVRYCGDMPTSAALRACEREATLQRRNGLIILGVGSGILILVTVLMVRANHRSARKIAESRPVREASGR